MKTHRLQILLDDERHERVRALAEQRRVSVATVIRDAIDRGLPVASHRREAAAARILGAPDMTVGEPEELRVELDQLRGRRG